MSRFTLGYVNFFVTDYKKSLQFFQNVLGLSVLTDDESFGYASFDTGAAKMAFAMAPDQPELIGRHTGIGLVVDNIDTAYEQMTSAGVEFDMAPSRQPWGGILALFRDPDGNVFYLDQIPDDHP